MGSFNVACGFSNMSINEGDRTSLFVMRPREDMNPYRNRTNIVTNEGSHSLMFPLLLPIHGVYADYGVINEIEENTYTKYLEDMMGMPIEEIAEGIARGRNANNSVGEKLKPFAGMFVLTEFFDAAADVVVNELGMNVKTEANVSANILRRLGFVETGKSEDEKERYNRRFEHPDSDTAYAMSDGTWTNLFEVGKEPDYQTLYDPGAFAEAWLKITGQPLDVGGMITESLWKNTGEAWHASLKRADNIKELSYSSKYANYFGRDFMELHEELLLSDNYIAIEEALEEYQIFNHLMFATNRLFRPTHNGEQFGNKAADNAVAQLIAKATSDKQKEHLERMEEYGY